MNWHGLYFLLDFPDDNLDQYPNQEWFELSRTVVNAGAQFLQLRAKTLPQTLQLEIALELAELCRGSTCKLIINDQAEVAAKVAGAGLHLGKDDLSVSEARKMLGPERIIGATCYNDIHRARQAEAAGADYVAFGRIYPSRTKPEATEAALATISEARKQLKLPIVAIGGITPENAPPVIKAGADLLAVSAALSRHTNPRQQADKFAALF